MANQEKVTATKRYCEGVKQEQWSR